MVLFYYVRLFSQKDRTENKMLTNIFMEMTQTNKSTWINGPQLYNVVNCIKILES